MSTRVAFTALLALAFSASQAQVLLFNNGGMVTHPGAGSGGADVSMASPAPFNTAGSNVRQTPDGVGQFRIADDFIITDPLGWNISTIRVHAYQTGANPPTWTGANLAILDGDPLGGPVNTLYSTSTVSFADSGIWRTFNGVTANTDRRIYQVNFDTSGLTLPTGTFWISWQVVGGVSGWASYVMQANTVDPNAPTTVFGNGRQLTVVDGSPTWQILLGSTGAETPFEVYGEVVPEPGTMIALALGAGALAARRRRKAAK